MADFRQSAGNAVANDATNTCTVTFDGPTQAGSLIVVIATAIHEPYGYWPLFMASSGFTQAVMRIENRVTLGIWYRAAAPSMSSVSVFSAGDDTLQVQVLEYTAAAQSSVLDKVTVRSDGSSSPNSGPTGTTAQADEIVIGVIANRWPSTTQSGFTGGLTRLSDTVSPSSWGRNYPINDDRRSRMTVHQALTTATGTWALTGKLATSRDWVAAVVTFKGGTIGPARMTSLSQQPIIRFGGRADLTVFGPLKSLESRPIIQFGGSGVIGPFELQWRLGGMTGLLIGRDTDYRVESVEGIGGWDVRTSDGDFPRGDGAARGVDLQDARQILFNLNFDDPDKAVLEERTAALLAALVPQRDEDWDLVFRLPGQPLQLVRCRPVQLARDLNLDQMLLRKQAFALRAADPRIYSAREKTVPIPVTPAGATAPAAVAAVNEGNARAYPVIRVENRDTVPVTAIQLVNATANVAFEISTVIAPGSQLIGDMPARITAAPRSGITLDGQTKYGAWQPPRTPFYLAPTPIAPDGVNALYLTTVPAGAAVVAAVDYRDTWSG